MVELAPVELAPVELGSGTAALQVELQQAVWVQLLGILPVWAQLLGTRSLQQQVHMV